MKRHTRDKVELIGLLKNVSGFYLSCNGEFQRNKQIWGIEKMIVWYKMAMIAFTSEYSLYAIM